MGWRNFSVIWISFFFSSTFSSTTPLSCQNPPLNHSGSSLDWARGTLIHLSWSQMCPSLRLSPISPSYRWGHRITWNDFPETMLQAIPSMPVKPGPFQLAFLLSSSLTTQAWWRKPCSQEVFSRIGSTQVFIPPGTDCLIISPVSHFLLSNVDSLGKDALGRENVYPVMTFLTRLCWACF